MTDFVEGAELPSLRVHLNRTDLIRYAAASGDFNPIHWNDRVAESVALPGVVAHGMLTMALGGRLITDWLGDPGAVVGYQVRFTRPVPVPDLVSGVDPDADTAGAEIDLTGKLVSITEAEDGTRTGKVDITVKFDGKTVLGRSSATVRLP